MSSPTRELTTQLNFTVNRANLDKFQGYIKAFKVSTAAAAAAISYAVSKTIDHFDNLARDTLRISDLAEAAGFAASEFKSMQDAAGKLGINTEQFQADFKKLSTTIQQARVGTGEFFRIFTESGQKIRLPDPLLTDAENFRNALKDIYTYVSELPTESRKLYVLSNLFSPDSAGRWKDAISQGFDTFERFVAVSTNQNANLDSQVEKLKEYNRAVNDLSTSWEIFWRELSVLVLPAVSASLNIASSLIKPNNTTPNYFAQDLAEEAEFLAGAESIRSIVNNFQFDVPAGTTEEQGIYMADMVRSTVEDVLQEQTRQVISNNPQME